MVIKKRYIVISLIFLIPIALVKSCQNSEKKHWMEYFPPPIKMEKMLVYETGCDGFFFCHGGVVVQMSEKDALQISEGSVEYLNGLPDTAVNGRHVGKWRAVDKSKQVRLLFSSRGKNEHKTRLRLALKNEDCYQTDSLTYICPKARLAYKGWSD